MAASDLYSNLLADLTNARSLMLSPQWQAELDASTANVRVSAGKQLIAIQGVILSLSNASLSDIATAMEANEAELTTCINGLTEALKDITKVQSILDSITKALPVVAKIVPLL